MNLACGKEAGFTLLELLVAMAISGVVMAGAYSLYNYQQRSYNAQTQLAEMQKNLRAAVYFLERDIRMAGCDPQRTGVAGIKAAEADKIEVTMDTRGGDSDGIDNDGDGSVDEADEAAFGDGDVNDPNEDVTYSLYVSKGVKKLGRKSSAAANNQPVAEDIESLRFVYLDGASNILDDDGAGNVTASIPAIRSVQITVTAGAPDSNRRKTLTAQVKCRNLAF